MFPRKAAARREWTRFPRLPLGVSLPVVDRRGRRQARRWLHPSALLQCRWGRRPFPGGAVPAILYQSLPQCGKSPPPDGPSVPREKLAARNGDGFDAKATSTWRGLWCLTPQEFHGRWRTPAWEKGPPGWKNPKCRRRWAGIVPSWHTPGLLRTVWGGVYLRRCGQSSRCSMRDSSIRPIRPAQPERIRCFMRPSLSYNSPRLRSTRKGAPGVSGGIHQWKPAGSRLVAGELHSGLHWDGVHLREQRLDEGRKSSWSWRLPIKSPSKTVGRAGAPPGIRLENRK